MKKKIGFFCITSIVIITFFNLSVITDQNTDISLNQLMQIANANAEESGAKAEFKIATPKTTVTSTYVKNGTTYTQTCDVSASVACPGTGDTPCTPKDPILSNCVDS